MALTVITDPTPTLTLELTPDEARSLREAQRRGVDLDAMLKGVIRRAAGAPLAGIAPETPVLLNLEEMEARVQQDRENSGMSDEELDTFVNDLVHRVRAEMNDEEQR